MAYSTGTIPVTANPAKDMMDALHPLITGNGYTFVEDFTSGAELIKVYKSSAASNGVADFYLYVRRTADTASAVTFTVSEAWDATGKKVQKYIPSTAGTPNAAANYTVNDPTGKTPTDISGTGIVYITVTIATAGSNAFNYWVSVNASRLVVAVRIVSTDAAVYAGLCDEVMPNTVGGSGMQLGAFRMLEQAVSAGTAGGTNAGCTREPNQTSGPTTNFATPILDAPQWGYAGGGLDVYTNRYYAARAVVGSNRGAGSPRGLLKGVIITKASGQVNGDTVTYGSSVYTKMSSSTGTLYADQGA
jgi:hypothetical protein